jgi:hypothetical protein
MSQPAQSVESSAPMDQQSQQLPPVDPLVQSVAEEKKEALPVVSILTALLHEDTTKPSTANVKVAHPLLKDGWNLTNWLYDLTTAAIHKECTEAFQKSMPYTKANAAAMMLITHSVPVEWGPMLTMQPSAFDALLYIARKYTGGHNKSVNRQWLHTLKTERMTNEETFETFVMKKFILYQNLLNNSPGSLCVLLIPLVLILLMR